MVWLGREGGGGGGVSVGGKLVGKERQGNQPGLWRYRTWASQRSVLPSTRSAEGLPLIHEHREASVCFEYSKGESLDIMNTPVEKERKK